MGQCFWTDLVKSVQDCTQSPPPGPTDIVYGGYQSNFVLFVAGDRPNGWDYYPLDDGGGIDNEGNLVYNPPESYFPNSDDDYLQLTSAVLYRLPRVRLPDWAGGPEPAFVADLSGQTIAQDTPSEWVSNGLLRRRFKGPLSGFPSLDPAYQYLLIGAVVIRDGDHDIVYVGSEEARFWAWQDEVDGVLKPQLEVIETALDSADVFLYQTGSVGVVDDPDYGDPAYPIPYYTIPEYKGLGFGTCDSFDASIDGQATVEIFADCS